MSPSKDCVFGEKLDRMDTTIQDIHRRLFIDNGTPCIQTRLDRHDAALAVLKWFGVTLCGAVIAVSVELIFGR